MKAGPKPYKKYIDIEVICKVRRLGGENGQFRHSNESNAQLGMEFYKTK